MRYYFYMLLIMSTSSLLVQCGEQQSSRSCCWPYLSQPQSHYTESNIELDNKHTDAIQLDGNTALLRQSNQRSDEEQQPTCLARLYNCYRATRQYRCLTRDECRNHWSATYALPSLASLVCCGLLYGPLVECVACAADCTGCCVIRCCVSHCCGELGGSSCCPNCLTNNWNCWMNYRSCVSNTYACGINYSILRFCCGPCDASSTGAHFP